MTRTDAMIQAAAYQLALCQISNMLEAGIPGDPLLQLNGSQAMQLTRDLERMAADMQRKIELLKAQVASSTNWQILNSIEYLICGAVNDE